MRIIRNLGRAVLGLAALTLIACQQTTAQRADLTPETRAARPAADQRRGDEVHPKIVAHYGGVYNDPRLTAYVDGIGRRIAAVSEQPGARWTFTVLDTPAVNAFAIPGGYVYVTRGLVALAGDEAELAGVIGHEIGHVTAGHNASRQERGTMASLGLLAGALGMAVLGVDPNLAGGVMDMGRMAAGGYLASYSRADELDADNLGIRYLARAGYDPQAQADFLERLGASHELQARVAGGRYDPNRVDFFASHPANADRTRRAIRVAEAAGTAMAAGADRGRDRFLRVIDGIVYGDSASQGFVEGPRFSHPKLGFTFTVPDSFTITNSADAVRAKGPRGGLFIFDGGRDPGGALTDYIARTWAPGVAREHRTGQLSGLRPERIGGLDAASAVLPVQVEGKAYDALLVAIRLDGTIYRLTGLAPRGSGLLPSFDRAAQSFRRLSPAEARALTETRIDIVTVRRGDTAESLARRMRVDGFALDRFLVLNGLRPGRPLRSGDKVKIVR